MNTLPPDDPLESALRRDASRRLSPVPQGMEWRISNAVARSERAREYKRPLVLWSALGAFAALAAAVAVFVHPGASPASPVSNAVQAADLAQSLKAMPGQIWQKVQPEAEAALQNDPVRPEARALVSDARSALGFLALNFLPDSPQPNG